MTGTIEAVQFPGSGQVVLTTEPTPQPGRGEVLLGLRAAGVCGSDLHFLRRSDDGMRHSTLVVHALGRDPR